MNKRGAYFFVLDALIGSAIFLISIVLIMSSYLNTPSTDQTYQLAESTMVLLMNSKVKEWIDPYVIYLANNNKIDNPEQSLFMQITEFHVKGEDEIATNLTRTILTSLIPDHYGISYQINETIIYNRSIEKINTSKFKVTSRKITFFKLNETHYYGPEISEVQLWV